METGSTGTDATGCAVSVMEIPHQSLTRLSWTMNLPGDPVPIPGSYTRTIPLERLPLVWTDSEYASAWPVYESSPPEIEFRRFDTDGLTLDAPWTYSAPATHGGLDLVWTGDGFGLFYVDMEVGLFFMRLDAEGKPRGDPVLIEADPRSRAPAADLREGGFIVAWVKEMGPVEGWSWCSGGEPLDLIKVRLISSDGSLIGPVVTVDSTGQGPPDVATGDGGFGLVMPVDYIDSTCATRFIHLDETLTDVTHSGILGRGDIGDVKWIDDHWVTSWPHPREVGPEEYDCYVAVAKFTSEGHLAAAPILNDIGRNYFPMAIRVAAGDGGLSLVAAAMSFQMLFFLRTDGNGTAVGPIHEVAPGGYGSGTFFGAYNTVWSADAFGVLFERNRGGVSDHGIWLRHFVAVE